MYGLLNTSAPNLCVKSSMLYLFRNYSTPSMSAGESICVRTFTTIFMDDRLCYQCDYESYVWIKWGSAIFEVFPFAWCFYRVTVSNMKINANLQFVNKKLKNPVSNACFPKITLTSQMLFLLIFVPSFLCNAKVITRDAYFFRRRNTVKCYFDLISILLSWYNLTQAYFEWLAYTSNSFNSR